MVGTRHQNRLALARAYQVLVDYDKAKVRLQERWIICGPDGKPDCISRPDGPAVTKWDASTGITIEERWCHRVRLHRENGPALIRRDRVTGVVVAEEWWRWGSHHREGGPAVIKRDRTSGAVIYEAFYENRKKLSERHLPARASESKHAMPNREGRHPRKSRDNGLPAEPS